MNIINGVGVGDGVTLFETLDYSELSYAEMQSDIDALIKFSTEGANKASHEAKNVFIMSRALTIALLAMAIIFGIGIRISWEEPFQDHFHGLQRTLNRLQMGTLQWIGSQ